MSSTKNARAAMTRAWELLFSSPVHLDSVLSKQSENVKRAVAEAIPVVLRRPASLAQALGIGMPAGEPWSLTLDQLKQWKAVESFAERLIGAPSAVTEIEALPEDFPPAMLQAWTEDWGAEVMSSLVASLSASAPTGLRVSARVQREDLLKQLRSENIGVSSALSDFAPFGIRLGGYAPVMNREGFARGEYEIQDEGSQLMSLFSLNPEFCAGLLQERPGVVTGKAGTWSFKGVKTVVDACAGAGGKSLAMADAMRGQGRVFSYDVSERKLQALRRRASREGLRNIQSVAVEEGNELATISRFKGSADVVLVDAPCSGWGVLRRNPDIKWRQGQEELKRLPEVQYRLLSVYSTLVKNGGRLVYGACTFRKAETQAVVERFLAENPGFARGPGGYLGPGPCDGFFMQEFVRKDGV